MNEIFAQFSLAACIKVGLEFQGYAVGDPVPPTAPLNDEPRKIVEQLLNGFK